MDMVEYQFFSGWDSSRILGKIQAYCKKYPDELRKNTFFSSFHIMHKPEGFNELSIIPVLASLQDACKNFRFYLKSGSSLCFLLFAVKNYDLTNQLLLRS